MLPQVISSSNDPPQMNEHFSKFTDATAEFVWELDAASAPTRVALGCRSPEGETFTFGESYLCSGSLEHWLSGLLAHQAEQSRVALHSCIASLASFSQTERLEWVQAYSSQHCLGAIRVEFTASVNEALEQMDSGRQQALVQLGSKLHAESVDLSRTLGLNMPKLVRRKVMNVVTQHLRNTEIVDKLCATDAHTEWKFSMKWRWKDEQGEADMYVSLLDFEMRYQHEYVGTNAMLVITPLTERVYITLTQALRIGLGGAPQGPAGTGKTETTKDLARVFAVWCLVINCSDQMTFHTMGNIFRGLLKTGAWGCFDEFNRIKIDVLSAMTQTLSAILGAKRAGLTQVDLGEHQPIPVLPSSHFIITMNPGYAGRTELPDNLKALFRPVSLTVPDVRLIMVNILMSEGFLNGAALGKKLFMLFNNCTELLSKQHHYDWGLRAINSVLKFAGKQPRSVHVRGLPRDRSRQECDGTSLILSGVLRFAGALNRKNPDEGEAMTVARAFYCMHRAKIVASDMEVLISLVSRYFPGKRGSSRPVPLLRVHLCSPHFDRAVCDSVPSQASISWTRRTIIKCPMR